MARTCGALGKVTAESDGLSILEMKSWFTCASAFPRECESPYNGIFAQFFSVKRNEALIHATSQMDLESILQSKRSQTQKGPILYDSICMKYWE